MLGRVGTLGAGCLSRRIARLLIVPKQTITGRTPVTHFTAGAGGANRLEHTEQNPFETPARPCGKCGSAASKVDFSMRSL